MTDQLIVPHALEAQQYWASGVEATLTRLVGQAHTVIAVADTPEPGGDPADCLTDEGSHLGTCVVEEGSRVAEGNRSVRDTAALLGAEYLDVERLVCFEGRCPMVVNRLITFADFGHISVSWSFETSPELDRMLRLKEH